MRQLLIGVLIGLLFGLGLLISGMGNPVKVQQFLDLAGAWDPSLAFVMLGAIAIAFVPFQLAKKQQLKTRDNHIISLPTATTIDRRLLIGSAIFGVGWGLVGICPGPALAILGTGAEIAWWFVPAMLVGMWSASWFSQQ